MPSRSFLTVADGSTVTFDADLAKSFQVTLAGNRSLVIAGGRDGDEIAILLVQDGTGSRVPSWGSNVTWEAGQAPNLTTAASGMNLITLVKRGNNWQDKSGAPSKLPSRLTAGALGVMTVLTGANAAMTFNLSRGNGEGVGNLPTVAEVRSNSGAQLNSKLNGTGSWLTGSGVNVVGVLDEKPAQTVGAVVSKVVPNPNVANGTGTLKVQGNKGGAVCYADTDGSGYTKCTANDGTQSCKVATVLECL